MIEFRPCGACAALVPAASGCEHWDTQKINKLNSSERARRERYRRWALRQKQKKESQA